MGQEKTSPQSCRGLEIQQMGTEALRLLEKSKAIAVQQTGVKSKLGGERGEPGRSCQTAWKQERHGCNF